jgi:hypothetical protein
MKQQINLDHTDILAAIEQYIAAKFPEFAEKDVRCKLYLDAWNRVVSVATVEDFPPDDGKTEEV